MTKCEIGWWNFFWSANHRVILYMSSPLWVSMPRSYFSQIGFCASIVLYFEENLDATKGHKPSKEKCFVTSFAILGLRDESRAIC